MSAGRISEAWSDRARVAAINARRLKMGHPVWADTNHFGRNVPAFIHHVNGSYAEIGIEEPDENAPGTQAVLDAHREMEEQGNTPVAPEFVDAVQLHNLRHRDTYGPGGSPYPDGTPIRGETPMEIRSRALGELRAKAIRDNAERLRSVSTGGRRSPELDAGLRTKPFRTYD